MEDIACFYTNLILLQKKGQKMTKNKLISVYFLMMMMGGSSFLALHSRGGLYSISISLISVP